MRFALFLAMGLAAVAAAQAAVVTKTARVQCGLDQPIHNGTMTFENDMSLWQQSFSLYNNGYGPLCNGSLRANIVLNLGGQNFASMVSVGYGQAPVSYSSGGPFCPAYTPDLLEPKDITGDAFGDQTGYHIEFHFTHKKEAGPLQFENGWIKSRFNGDNQECSFAVEP